MLPLREWFISNNTVIAVILDAWAMVTALGIFGGYVMGSLTLTALFGGLQIILVALYIYSGGCKETARRRLEESKNVE